MGEGNGVGRELGSDDGCGVGRSEGTDDGCRVKVGCGVW